MGRLKVRIQANNFGFDNTMKFDDPYPVKAINRRIMAGLRCNW